MALVGTAYYAFIPQPTLEAELSALRVPEELREMLLRPRLLSNAEDGRTFDLESMKNLFVLYIRSILRDSGAVSSEQITSATDNFDRSWIVCRFDGIDWVARDLLGHLSRAGALSDVEESARARMLAAVRASLL